MRLKTLTTLCAKIDDAYRQGRYQATLDMALLLGNASFIPLPSRDRDQNQAFVDGTINAVQDQHAKIKELTAEYSFFERWAYRRGYRSVS